MTPNIGFTTQKHENPLIVYQCNDSECGYVFYSSRNDDPFRARCPCCGESVHHAHRCPCCGEWTNMNWDLCDKCVDSFITLPVFDRYMKFCANQRSYKPNALDQFTFWYFFNISNYALHTNSSYELREMLYMTWDQHFQRAAFNKLERMDLESSIAEFLSGGCDREEFVTWLETESKWKIELFSMRNFAREKGDVKT